MSWKSLLTTGLLCIVAAPAFANPTLYVTNHELDANGNWIWDIDIGATTGTSPVAAELGFVASDGGTAGQQLLSATPGAPFTGTNTQNPGTQIFTWETLDVTANNKPVGLQTNCTTGCSSALGGGLDQIFSAMGSFADLPIAASPPAAGVTTNRYMRIITAGPTSLAPATSLQTQLQVLGKYATGGGAGANGRIAEITSGTNATNYNNFAATAQRTAKGGDINLSGTVDLTDATTFGTNWQATGVTQGWNRGDFNRDGSVDLTDATFFGTNWQQSGGSITNQAITGAPGAGASLGLSAGGVPEPATITLIALAVLGGMGFVRRR